MMNDNNQPSSRRPLIAQPSLIQAERRLVRLLLVIGAVVLVALAANSVRTRESGLVAAAPLDWVVYSQKE